MPIVREQVGQTYGAVHGDPRARRRSDSFLSSLVGGRLVTDGHDGMDAVLYVFDVTYADQTVVLLAGVAFQALAIGEDVA